MHYPTTKPHSYIATSEGHSEVSMSLTMYTKTLKGCEKTACKNRQCS